MAKKGGGRRGYLPSEKEKKKREVGKERDCERWENADEHIPAVNRVAGQPRLKRTSRGKEQAKFCASTEKEKRKPLGELNERKSGWLVRAELTLSHGRLWFGGRWLTANGTKRKNFRGRKGGRPNSPEVKNQSQQNLVKKKPQIAIRGKNSSTHRKGKKIKAEWKEKGEGDGHNERRFSKKLLSC